MENGNSNNVLNITLRKAGVNFANKVMLTKKIEGEKKIFLGDPDSPFLAPRGVFVCGSKLLVSDTGQNRVFIWNKFPTQTKQKPDLVIGQPNHMNTGRNAGGATNSQSLQYPSAVWTDSEKLVIADAWNHRVLIWNKFPTQDYQPADVVIGQRDFFSNLPNKHGVNTEPSASSLYWPYGVAVYDGKLFVADTGNRRVLVYDQIPNRIGQSADFVIGQEGFESRSYDSNNAVWPYSIALGPNGELAITDTQYYRVLLWDHWKQAMKERAHSIIGQQDFAGNGQNQFGFQPGPNTLNWCYFANFFQNGIFVLDTGNSRVLWFETVPQNNDAPANSLIGKPDFYTGSEFADTVFGTEKSLYWPFSFGLSSTSSQIIIADTGNHRIVICDLLLP